jgi:peptidyl-tRNA hydrolase, PTH1 family
MIFRRTTSLVPPAVVDFVVVGLGNPGRKYAATRHNIGFRIVDALTEQAGKGSWTKEHQAETRRIQVEGRSVLVAKPQTFMNESGRAVQPLLARNGLGTERLLIVNDDLDLPFGRLRLRARGSAGGHNGLRSVTALLGTQEYARLRAGIGRPDSGDVLDWVLSPFSPAEEIALPHVCETAVSIIQAILRDGVLAAMNAFNGSGIEPPIHPSTDRRTAERDAESPVGASIEPRPTESRTNG